MHKKNIIHPRLNIPANGDYRGYASTHQNLDDHGELVERDSFETLHAKGRNPTSETCKPDIHKTSRQDKRSNSSDQHYEGTSPNLGNSVIDIPGDLGRIEEIDEVQNSNAPQSKIEGDEIDKLFEGLA